jgi:hypothetical protein
VLLPDDVRKQLDLEHGGGVSFIPNEESGRFELWTTDEVEDRIIGGNGSGDNA